MVGRRYRNLPNLELFLAANGWINIEPLLSNGSARQTFVIVGQRKATISRPWPIHFVLLVHRSIFFIPFRIKINSVALLNNLIDFMHVN